MKKIPTLLFILFLGFSFAQAQNMDMENTVTVGGEMMYPSKNIIENAVNSEAHTTLVAAVKAAGLVETLQGEGPFTVFAPTNDAFENLPEGTVSSLLKSENKDKLVNILTYHVISGDLSYEDLANAIEEGGGQAEFETVSGETLTFMWNGPHNIVVMDESGRVAHISTYNVNQSNGVIHVVDTVLLPGM